MRLSFISCFISRRECWEDHFDFERYAGFGFMAMIYQRVWDKDCIMIGDSLVMQRASISAWKASWPKYCLLSMPRCVQLLAQESDKQVHLRKWRNRYTSGRALLYILIQAKAFGFSKEKIEWQEAMNYQNARNRWLARIFTLLVPVFLCRNLLNYLTLRKRKLAGAISTSGYKVSPINTYS